MLIFRSSSKKKGNLAILDTICPSVDGVVTEVWRDAFAESAGTLLSQEKPKQRKLLYLFSPNLQIDQLTDAEFDELIRDFSEISSELPPQIQAKLDDAIRRGVSRMAIARCANKECDLELGITVADDGKLLTWSIDELRRMIDGEQET